MQAIISRADYMNGKATHRQYYGQFVNAPMVAAVVRQIGKDKLLASTDPHLNDIPLHRWDVLALPPLACSMKGAGDFLTIAGKVCIAKEAARQWLDANEA